MTGFWLIFLIWIGLVIFRLVSKKMDVFSEDFPSVKPDEEESKDHTSRKKENEEKESVFEYESNPEVRNESEVLYEPEPEPYLKPEPEPESVRYTDYSVVNSADRLFGLIGKPLGHSKSEQLFKTRFSRQHISADYCNFELDSIEALPEMISSNPKLCGFNVTIPYKEAVIPYLDKLDESAQAVGAVNAVKVERNGESVRLIGYNTDCMGFMESIKEYVGDRKKALILGTGGAAKAVRHAFDILGIESRYVSRNSTFDILGYFELSPSIMDEYTIIVNCTPVGMYPDVDQCPDIPYSFLSSEHLLYDVIYNPQETLFMKKGKERGATVIGGEDMFELQAGASWNIWNGQE